MESALDVLKVGQEVKARVLEVDLERKRIALSLKKESAEETRGTGQTSRNTNSSRGNRPAKDRTNAKSPHSTSSRNIKNNAFAALKNFKVK